MEIQSINSSASGLIHWQGVFTNYENYPEMPLIHGASIGFGVMSTVHNLVLLIAIWRTKRVSKCHTCLMGLCAVSDMLHGLGSTITALARSVLSVELTNAWTNHHILLVYLPNIIGLLSSLLSFMWLVHDRATFVVNKHNYIAFPVNSWPFAIRLVTIFIVNFLVSAFASALIGEHQFVRHSLELVEVLPPYFGALISFMILVISLIVSWNTLYLLMDKIGTNEPVPNTVQGQLERASLEHNHGDSNQELEAVEATRIAGLIFTVCTTLPCVCLGCLAPLAAWFESDLVTRASHFVNVAFLAFNTIKLFIFAKWMKAIKHALLALTGFGANSNDEDAVRPARVDSRRPVQMNELLLNST